MGTSGPDGGPPPFGGRRRGRPGPVPACGPGVDATGPLRPPRPTGLTDTGFRRQPVPVGPSGPCQTGVPSGRGGPHVSTGVRGSRLSPSRRRTRPSTGETVVFVSVLTGGDWCRKDSQLAGWVRRFVHYVPRTRHL